MSSDFTGVSGRNILSSHKLNRDGASSSSNFNSTVERPIIDPYPSNESSVAFDGGDDEPKPSQGMLNRLWSIFSNLLLSVVAWIKGYDKFGSGDAAPFNLNGVGSAKTFLGGVVGFGIKFLTTTFFLFKMIEMTTFTKP